MSCPSCSLMHEALESVKVTATTLSLKRHCDGVWYSESSSKVRTPCFYTIASQVASSIFGPRLVYVTKALESTYGKSIYPPG
jgi:hypothetical protein